MYVRLIGRLGNQLFQYAAGRRLAALKSADLRLDTTYYGWRSRDRYELGVLRISPKLARRTEIAALRGSRVSRLLHPGMHTAARLVEPHFHFWPDLLSRREPVVYLDGYWQSERYFVDIRDTLLRELVPQQAPSKEARRLMDLAAEPDAVSVHVRRGDYVHDPRTSVVHPALPLGYYERAVARLVREGLRPHLFVFSDDVTWCRAYFKIGTAAGITFVSDQIDSPVEELHLMRHFRSHIIANSSFSWWGAWLADHPDKRVIAPAQWFTNTDRDDRDLVPAEWTRL